MVAEGTPDPIVKARLVIWAALALGNSAGSNQAIVNTTTVNSKIALLIGLLSNGFLDNKITLGTLFSRINSV